MNGSGTHSQNSSNVGLMSLLPADAVESPKVILSESRQEEIMRDGGTQVAGNSYYGGTGYQEGYGNGRRLDGAGLGVCGPQRLSITSLDHNKTEGRQ